MADLSSFSKSLKKDFKDTMFTEPKWEHRVIPTGVPAIDFATYAGGFGEGRITELFGPYSSGKSLLLYRWLIQNQLNGGLSFLYEAEGGFHEDFFRSMGGLFDTGSPHDLHLVPDLRSVEDFFDGVTAVIDKVKKAKLDVPVAIGWDSLAATSSKHVNSKKAGEGHAAKKAAVISEGASVLMSKLQGTRIALLNTNQIRVKPGAKDWEDTHTPGGKAWPYACSTRVELEFAGGPKGSQIIDEKTGIMIGRMLRGCVVKNKLGPPMGKFRMPVYVQEGFPHPEFEDHETKVGIDLEECLFYWYAQNPLAVFGKDKQKFMESGGGGYYSLHPDAFGEQRKFRKKEWLKVLEEVPMLWTPKEVCVE